MKATPLVSIIVTSKNEAQNIGRCIESLTLQTYKKREIIVVDNNSSDATKEVAKHHKAMVYDKGPERSAQRNFGAKKAQGEYLMFLDADMILTPRVVEECVRVVCKSQAEKKEVIALIIPEISVGSGFWARCKALERSFYVGVGWIEAARFYKTSAFDVLQGYDETLTGPEDFDIHQRLRDRFGDAAIGRISSFIQHNEGTLSLVKVIQKKFYYARNMKQYAQKISSKGYYKKQSNILVRYMLFLKHPLALFRNPLLGIGMLILKTIEFGAGFLGFVYYTYVKNKYYGKNV